MSAKSYYDRTYNSPNPLIRWAHRSRFKNSIKAIDLTKSNAVLDFGCGDGLFLNQLKNTATQPINLLGFEPYMDAISNNKVSIHKSWDDIVDWANTNTKFDYVTCFEVLEHFGPGRQAEALNKMKSVLNKNGHIIISVPIEIGFASLVKNLIRKAKQPKENYYYKPINIWKSFLGKPLPHLRNDTDYLAHMGFSFKQLEMFLQSATS